MADEKLDDEYAKKLRCPKCGGGRVDGDKPYCSCKSPFQVCRAHAQAMTNDRRAKGLSVDLDEIAATACDVQEHPQLKEMVRRALK